MLISFVSRIDIHVLYKPTGCAHGWTQDESLKSHVDIPSSMAINAQPPTSFGGERFSFHFVLELNDNTICLSA